MKIKLEDLKPLRLYGVENEGSTLSLKVSARQRTREVRRASLRRSKTATASLSSVAIASRGRWTSKAAPSATAFEASLLQKCYSIRL